MHLIVTVFNGRQNTEPGNTVLHDQTKMTNIHLQSQSINQSSLLLFRPSLTQTQRLELMERNHSIVHMT